MIFGCYMRVIERWSMRVTHEFEADLENILKRRYYLYRNENELIGEFSEPELIELKRFLTGYKEPEQLRATKA